MKRVMITGCMGFLGSHLAARHLSAGDIVLGVDDFASSNCLSHHVRQLLDNPNFIFEELDICDYVGLINVAKNIGYIDVTYNFACPASPPRYQALPITTLMTCVEGTKNVFDCIRTHNKHFSQSQLSKSIVVHASTSEVYGDPNVSPQTEKYWGNVNSHGPRSMYDEGKRAAEALAWCYQDKSLLDVRIMRIFNTYGTNMDPDDGRVVTNFIKQAGNDQDITVYGDGTQTRSFCYVDDLIDGAVAFGDAKAKYESSPLYGEPFNFGNPKEFSMNDLAHIVKYMFPQSKSHITFAPLPGDDPTQRRPDISRAKEMFGWEPKVSLKEGMWRLANDWYERKIIKHAPVRLV